MQAGNPKKLALALGALLVAGAVLARGLLGSDLGGDSPASAAVHPGDRPASGGSPASRAAMDEGPATGATSDEGPATGATMPEGLATGATIREATDTSLGGAMGGPQASGAATRAAPRGQDATQADGGLPVASAKTKADLLAANLAEKRDELRGEAGVLDRMIDSAPGSGPSPNLEASAPSGLSSSDDDSVDWARMFEDLLERQHPDSDPLPLDTAPLEALEVLSAAGSEPPGIPPLAPAVDPTLALASMELRGVLAGPTGGVALLDGYLLRPGDAVPGTRFEVVEIHRDRVELTHPDLSQPVRMLLEPLSSTAGTSSGLTAGSAASTPGRAPFDGDSATGSPEGVPEARAVAASGLAALAASLPASSREGAEGDG